MSLHDLVQASKIYLPDLQVKYKNESALMQCIGLFLNKKFIYHYITTIGSTIYFPSRLSTRINPTRTNIMFLHELVHVKEAQKLSKLLFGFLYFFPQSLAILLLPLLCVDWRFIFPCLILLAPIPAFFRMQFEKRAYFVSLYVSYILGKRLKFNPVLDIKKEKFKNQFKNSSYYFMWPFGNLDEEFNQAVEKIKSGRRPFEDPIFDMLDDLTNRIT